MAEHSMESDRKYLLYLWRNYFDKQTEVQRSTRPFSCNVRRPIDFDYKKTSPVYILREQLDLKKSISKIEKQKYKSKQYLQEKLDENCNVFMTGHEVNRKDLQNILWEKNYVLKSSINQLKQENNNIKAKVWNFEKENRKMQKQIDNWNLEKYPLLQGKKTPYLDSNTMDKVFQDQDYSVVTMKIQLAKLSEILKQKDQQIKKNNQVLNNSQNYQQQVSGRIALEAKKLIKIVTEDNLSSIEQLKLLHTNVLQNNQKISLLQQQVQLARASLNSYRKEKQQLQKPIQPLLDIYKDVRLSFKFNNKKYQEPTSQLRNQIEHQKDTISNLQFKIQEIINQSLTQKQGLRREIKELEKEIQPQQQAFDI